MSVVAVISHVSKRADRRANMLRTRRIISSMGITCLVQEDTEMRGDVYNFKAALLRATAYQARTILFIEDDMHLATGFEQHLQQVLALEDCNNIRVLASLPTDAKLELLQQGATWAISRNYAHMLTLLPSSIVPEFLHWMSLFQTKQATRFSDLFMEIFLATRKIPVFVSLYSLAEHDGDVSMAGNRGLRKCLNVVNSLSKPDWGSKPVQILGEKESDLTSYLKKIGVARPEYRKRAYLASLAQQQQHEETHGGEED